MLIRDLLAIQAIAPNMRWDIRDGFVNITIPMSIEDEQMFEQGRALFSEA